MIENLRMPPNEVEVHLACQKLGFSLEEIRTLVCLVDGNRPIRVLISQYEKEYSASNLQYRNKRMSMVPWGQSGLLCFGGTTPRLAEYAFVRDLTL